MKNGSIVVIILGLLLLVAGAVLYVNGGGPPKADAALAQACRDEVKARGGDAAMTEQCGEVAFATALTATDADTAARSIGAANMTEIGGSDLSMVLLGLGLVLTVGGIALRRSRRRRGT